MKTQIIKELVYDYLPLKQIVKLYKVEQVKELFGTVGCDIFEGRTPNIVDNTKLTGKSGFLNEVAGLFGLKSYQCKYNESDNFHAIWTKFVANHDSGSISDMQEHFGKCGEELLKIWQNLGYIK